MESDWSQMLSDRSDVFKIWRMVDYRLIGNFCPEQEELEGFNTFARSFLTAVVVHKTISMGLMV